jgi:nucleotide-binding universal stress UspA family protein
MEADVIVVGRRRGRLHHVLGSVSSRIVRRARCSVLVVHDAVGPCAGSCRAA